MGWKGASNGGFRMTDCQYCDDPKATVTAKGYEVELCLNFNCIVNRWLGEYEDCSHDLQTVQENLLQCSDCGMNATPSYL